MIVAVGVTLFFEEPFSAFVTIAGLPRVSERRSRVRRIYSLLQEASALTRVNERREDLCISSSEEAEGNKPVDSAPGKNRAKAILHAGGAVTSRWKRVLTKLIKDSDSGGRWERM